MARKVTRSLVLLVRVLGWCVLVLTACVCLTYGAAKSMWGLYECIAVATLLYLPFRRLLRQWAKPLYVVLVVLVTLPWAFPNESFAFALHLNSLHHGSTMSQVEAAMEPYWKRSQEFQGSGIALPKRPLPARFTGRLYFTWRTENKFYDFGTIDLKDGAVTEIALFDD